MNSFLKPPIQLALKIFAKLYIFVANPFVIVISGTTNRHWIKEEVVKILKEKKLSTRGNQKNFNAEIGLPLSIMGLPSGQGNFYSWLTVLKWGLSELFKKDSSVKEYLVLELAISNPTDMDYLLSIVNPDVAIFTTVTMIYSENFEDLDQIAREYKKLAEIVPKEGLIIINNDDERIKNLAPSLKCETISYAVDKEADYKAQNLKKISDGQQFSLNDKMIKISRFGKHHVYANLVGKIIDDFIKK